MELKNLFSLEKENITENRSNAGQQNRTAEREQRESYHDYGARICGIVTGSLPALTSYLTKIYTEERRDQINDQNTQEQLREKRMSELAQANASIANIEADIASIQSRIANDRNNLSDKENELSEAIAKDGEVNKMARIKLIIGISILAILTVYLFIFYSSTFYSAFLFNPYSQQNVSLGTAMFNTQALSLAWNEGIGTFIFIITAPVIFMGLGYTLHYFAIQESNAKWLKMSGILLVTLIFDCILAYKIGEMLYNMWIMTQMGNFEPYSFRMAVEDINSWAVIFCGFIVYVIWGVIFDMVMTAYENLRSNKHEINQLRRSISAIQGEIAKQEQQLPQIQAKLVPLNETKRQLEDRINHNVFWDNGRIKSALSGFIAGWLSIMAALNLPQTSQDEAGRIYEETVNQLFNS